MAMNRQRRTANINNIVTYDTLKNVTLLADLTIEGLTGAGFVKADVNGLLSVDTGAYLPMPSQTGNAGKYLTTDGANLSWGTVSTANIYNSNGTLTSDRTINTNNAGTSYTLRINEGNEQGIIFHKQTLSSLPYYYGFSGKSVPIGTNGNSSNYNVVASFNGNGLHLNAGQIITLGIGGTFGMLLTGANNLIIQNGGTFTDAGYKLDVQGTGRFTGNGTFNDITIGQNGGDRYIGWSLNDLKIYVSSTRIAAFSASGVVVDNTLVAGNGTTLSSGTEISGYSNKLIFPSRVAHTQTHVLIGQSDDTYLGNTTQPGNIWIYPGKNTTNNSFGNIHLAHNGTEARGNVAIGSSAAPSYRLDVTGTGRFTGALYSNTCVYATGNQSDGALNVSNPNSSGFNTVIINRADVTNCFGNIVFIDRKTGASNRGFSIGIGMSGDPTWADGDFLFGNYTGSGGYNQSARIYNATGNWRIGATGSDSGYKLDVQGSLSIKMPSYNSTGFQLLNSDGNADWMFYNNGNNPTNSRPYLYVPRWGAGTPILIGNGASSGVNNAIGIGQGSGLNNYSIAIGTPNGSSVGANSIVIGSNVNNSGTRSTLIGNSSYNIGNGFRIAHDDSFAIGNSHEYYTTANYQGILSATDIYIGRPARSASGSGNAYQGTATSINGMGGYGVTDSTGGNLIIAGGIGLGAGTPGDVIFSTATPTSTGTTLQTLTQRVWVKGDNGNVGIGSSPNAAYKLDVSGTGRFTNTLSIITTGTTNDVALFKATEPYITIEAAGGSNSASIFLKPSTSSQNATIQNRTGGGLEFYTGATPSLAATITAANNLVIGSVTSAAQKLQVSSTSGDNHLLVWGATAPSIRIDNAATGSTQRFVFGLATAASNFITGSVAGDVCMTTQSSNPLLFGANSTEVMRITINSNLLINKISDGGQKLQVSGSINFASLPTSATGLSAGDIWNNGGVLNIV